MLDKLVQLARQETRDFKDLSVQLEPLGIQAIKVRLGLLVALETRVPQDKLDHQEPREILEPLVIRDQQVQPDPQDLLVLLGKLATKALLDQLVMLVRQEIKVCRVLKVLLEYKDRKEILDQQGLLDSLDLRVFRAIKVLLEIKESQVHLVIEVCLEQMVLLEIEDLWVLLEQLAQQEMLDKQEIRAFREILVLLEIMVSLDLRVLLVLREILAQTGLLDLLVQLEPQVTQEPQETEVPPDQTEIKDQLVVLALSVQLAILEIAARWVRLELLVNQVKQVCLVIREPWAHPVQQGTGAFKVILGLLVELVLPVLLEIPELQASLAQQDLWVPLERKVLLGLSVNQASEVILVQVVSWAVSDLLVLQGQVELLGIRVLLGIPDLRDLLVHREALEQLVLLDQVEHRDSLVIEDQQEIRGFQEMLEILVQQEILD